MEAGDLTINLSNIDTEDIKSCWEWLLKDISQILMISKLGDMFLEGNDKAVYWLATEIGELNKIADDVPSFRRLLQDENNIEEWFLPLFIKELIAKGMILKPDEVYSYKLLPVMGGEYAVDNIEPTNISVHFAITGQILEQIKKLPSGTQVKIKIVD
jgi:hypothetical protein